MGIGVRLSCCDGVGRGCVLDEPAHHVARRTAATGVRDGGVLGANGKQPDGGVAFLRHLRQVHVVAACIDGRKHNGACLELQCRNP